MTHKRESIPNAIMATSSFDRNSGIPGDTSVVINQPFNNFRIQTKGENIIQGQLNRIKVAEIFFPYALPTVISGYGALTPAAERDVIADNAHMYIIGSIVTLSAGGTVATWTNGVLSLNVPTGFYTGEEMVAYLNAQVSTWAFPNAANLIITYDQTTQRIKFENYTSWNGADGVGNTFFTIVPAYGPSFPAATFGTNVSTNARAIQQPQLAWTLGLRTIYAKYPPVQVLNAAVLTGAQNPFASPVPTNVAYYGPTLVPNGYPNDAGASNNLPVFPAGYFPSAIVGANYTGRYTDYIDVTSTSLCAAQYVRDGNTNQNVVRRDLVCRLYIADENSSPLLLDGSGQLVTVGSRPFVIHRQFQNPKTMFWNVNRAIDSIDLELYDMFGLPLPKPQFNSYNSGDGFLQTTLTAEQSDYAITFLVEEGADAEQNANIGYRY